MLPVKTMTKGLAGSPVLGGRGQAGEENGRRGQQGLVGTEATVRAGAVLCRGISGEDGTERLGALTAGPGDPSSS